MNIDNIRVLCLYIILYVILAEEPDVARGIKKMDF